MNKSMLGVGLFLSGASEAIAGVTNAVALFPASLPTLDEVGLVGLMVVVAIAGGIAARRRKKK